ncbi:MAG: pyridoxal-dependent decarboxylase [Flammeovirgaceae bacterium]|nr:pyridoxal-dependent decarboxylase [Flammeovirgaceae bacterium]
MHELLKKDLKNIPSILSQAKRLAVEHFESQDEKPAGRLVQDISLDDLPIKGIGAEQTLNHFERNFSTQLSNSAGSRYFGFVTGGSTPASVVGDWLVSAYDQNACGSNDSIAPQIEKQTMHFFKQLFGLDDAYFGSFVTGATMANFVGLAQARHWVGEQYGVDFSNEGLIRPVKILSGTPHSSIIKSLSMLGVGRKSMIKVPTLPDREAVDLEELERNLWEASAPLIVVANAGTVNTVDFDDLEAIGQLKKKYNFWLHVDAAFGGFASISEKFAHLMKGINHADSITIDAHKWLNVPYDAAMQFTRHQSIQLKVFQNSAAYLSDPEKSPDYFHYTPENSRRWRALPSWFSLVAYGKEGHSEIVERNCELAKQLGVWIDSSESFKLLSPVRMNVVCFTLKKENFTIEEINSFLDRVRDDGRAFFTPTFYKGVPAIRAAISNWQTTSDDMEITINALKELSYVPA